MYALMEAATGMSAGRGLSGGMAGRAAEMYRWRPQTATTWQVWYRNDLIEVRHSDAIPCTQACNSTR